MTNETLDAAIEIKHDLEMLHDHINVMSKAIWHSLKFNNGSDSIKDPALYAALVKTIEAYYTPRKEQLQADFDKLK